MTCDMKKQKKPGNLIRSLLIGGLALTGLMTLPTTKAYAVCGGCTPCSVWSMQVDMQFQIHKNWMINEWWNQYVEPAIMKTADQINQALASESLAIGSFFDAQNHLASMLALQELNATTLNSYSPSTSLCQFGTLTTSLAASEAKARANQVVLSERSQNRQLGNNNMASQTGPQEDRWARLDQFKNKFCDPADFNNSMKELCKSTKDTQRNIDIDFTRALDTKHSLDIDFTNTALTDDEENVIALANNLYSHDVLSRINAGALSDTNAVDVRSTYLDQRSIVAKRSVAENSFNALVGDKSAGTVSSKTYLEQVLKNLGLPAADLPKYLGDKPSYDAQMEILTKKLYQDPAFYANLMDKPANVQRQYAALQSFGLMQQRDIFESVLRSEMLLSLIVEMEVSKYQDDIQNSLNSTQQ